MPREGTRRSERLAEELRQVLGALMRRLRAESADHALSFSEQAVLRRLQDLGPSTTATLARAEMVKPQSMGASLAALEEAGLVTRTANPSDARCRNVAVTAEGQRLLAAGRAARQNWLARSIDVRLDAEEQRALRDAIALVRRVVE